MLHRQRSDSHESLYAVVVVQRPSRLCHFSAEHENMRVVTGSFIAMSVFQPQVLAPLEAANGHAYYLYHSPEDRVCPYRMAEQAKTSLAENGAKVRLETYKGGHGWTSGNVYRDIRNGVEWLEKNQEKSISRP